MGKIKLHLTEDGSHTLFSEQFQEIYHSRYGALQESKHVFIEAGLQYRAEEYPDKPIHVLEIGWGTGLNAYLSFLFMKQARSSIDLHYTGLEPIPIPEELITELNYPALLSEKVPDLNFEALHGLAWEQVHALGQGMFLEKKQSRIQDFNTPERYNLVYFDAFAPSKHPEMWELSVFEKIAGLLDQEACLVTYCAKGAVKRNLQAAGFEIEKLPGPPGKREMIRAHWSDKASN